MCELLNQAFGKVFTKEDLSDIPEAKWEYSVNGGVGLCYINIDDIRVMHIVAWCMRVWSENRLCLG